MHPMLSTKVSAMVFPTAITDDGSATTTEIDTKGWDFLSVYVYVGTTDVAMAALAVTESDTSGSGHSNITGAVWGTATDIDGNTTALPSATDDNKFEVAHIDLRGRKRYVDVTATAGDGTAGTWIYGFYILSKGASGPNSSSEMGAEHVVVV